MNSSSAEEQPIKPDSQAEVPPQRRVLPASIGHQLLTLVGFSFLFFEIIFVELYSDNFWFSLDISWLGIPAILISALITHFLLIAAQSDWMTRRLYWLRKGRPLLNYRRWLVLDETGFGYGLRHVAWKSIDELFLTFFGNLEIRSTALSGDVSGPLDPLFKIPFGIGSQPDQKILVETAMANNPNLKCNQRLQKRINSPIVRGQNAIQLGGAVFMALILFDVGYSSLSYLEMLKHYYLAHTDALSGHSDTAQQQLFKADEMRSHPLPISYVTNRFLSVGTAAAGIHQVRANILWAMNKRDEAVAEVGKAIEISPESFRLYLMRARFEQEMGKKEEAQKDVDTAIDKHKDSLLPRLYSIALATDTGGKDIKLAFTKAMDDLNESTFAGEPMWPPGGDRFVHDLYYSQDIYFVFNRLLHTDLKPNSPANTN